jgi:hypothetical protein
MDGFDIEKAVNDSKGQYPYGINVYDSLKTLVKEGGEMGEEMRPVLKTLNQAMFETNVAADSYSKIGDIIMRLSQAAANSEELMSIDTTKIPGMEPVMNTYDRFLELQEEEEDDSDDD